MDVSQISRELKVQLIDEFGSIPKTKLYNCVGGGSSSFGFGMNLWIMTKNNVNLSELRLVGLQK